MRPETLVATTRCRTCVSAETTGPNERSQTAWLQGHGGDGVRPRPPGGAILIFLELLVTLLSGVSKATELARCKCLFFSFLFRPQGSVPNQVFWYARLRLDSAASAPDDQAEASQSPVDCLQPHILGESRILSFAEIPILTGRLGVARLRVAELRWRILRRRARLRCGTRGRVCVRERR